MPKKEKHFTAEHRMKIRLSKLGKKPTEETRKKMSESHKGKLRSIEYRKNISEAKKGNKNPMYGKELSEEHRKKISISLKGIKKGKLPDYVKRKISMRNKGRKISKETKEESQTTVKSRRSVQKKKGKYLKLLKRVQILAPSVEKRKMDFLDPNFLKKVNKKEEDVTWEPIEDVAEIYRISSRQIRRYIRKKLIEGRNWNVLVPKEEKTIKISNALFIRNPEPYLEKLKNYKGWIKGLGEGSVSNKQASDKIRYWTDKKYGIRTKKFFETVPFSSEEPRKIEKEYKQKRYKKSSE